MIWRRLGHLQESTMGVLTTSAVLAELCIFGALVNILFAVVTPETVCACARVFVVVILTGASVVTWICDAIVDLITIVS